MRGTGILQTVAHRPTGDMGQTERYQGPHPSHTREYVPKEPLLDRAWTQATSRGEPDGFFTDPDHSWNDCLLDLTHCQ